MLSIEWETPQDFFDELDREFHFTLDVCALDHNTKCKQYFSPKEDGLVQKWNGVCWLNPPFDTSMGKWIEKAYLEAQKGITTVCLIHGNYHDNEWWHTYIMKANEIRYIRGRLIFTSNGKKTSMRTLLVIFKPYCQGPPATKSIDTKGIELRQRKSNQGVLGF